MQAPSNDEWRRAKRGPKATTSSDDDAVTRLNQPLTLRLSAESLPLRRSVTSSNSSF
jgi:hypothetical protein